MGVDVDRNHSYASLYSNSESVSNWLWNGARASAVVDQSVQETQGREAWQQWQIGRSSPLRQSRLRLCQDADQSSSASIDDSVSLSDSTHGSYSSESTAPTSWASNTGSADQFVDDDDFRSENCVSPRPTRSDIATNLPRPSEFQDQLLRGVSLDDGLKPAMAQPLPTNPRRSKWACLSRTSDATLKFYKQISQPCSKPVPETSSDLDGQKCHSRRSNVQCKELSPPSLRRDTANTDDFVGTLIIFATKLVMTIWPFSSAAPRATSCYNGNSVLPLRVFIQETLRRSKTSYSTLQIALYYLVLLKDRLPAGDSINGPTSLSNDEGTSARSKCRAMQCGRRMFLSALMLASKYLQDRNYSTRAWSKISGLRSNEINDNEREYLIRINYDLHVPKECFDNWNRVVLALCKLTKISKSCQSPLSSSGDRSVGGGSSQILADMVSQVELKESSPQDLFGDEWWSQLVANLDPAIVKDASRTNEFLSTHLPESTKQQPQLAQIWNTCALPSSPSASSTTSSSEGPSFTDDMNIGDSLRMHGNETPRSLPSQTPVQMSPASGCSMPLQPKPRNLPTPQSTPRVVEACSPFAAQARSSLRCSASMGALRNMQRQCFMNANLDRCPPPRPHNFSLPPAQTLMRPAVTIQESRTKENTPVTSSPMSMTSELTTTTRSRSSSISSNSSWSSLCSGRSRPRVAGECQFSSPLARVLSASDRRSKPAPVSQAPGAEHSFGAKSRPEGSTNVFVDEGYGSSEEPARKPRRFITETEVHAANALMWLSTQDDSTSQSVTPKPKPCTPSRDIASEEVSHDTPRGHKRSLSKITGALQSQVRRSLLAESMSCEVVEDEVSESTPKAWQFPIEQWAAPRRAIPNATDTKRIASYSSLHHVVSAPDLASQYLRHSMVAPSLNTACSSSVSARHCAVLGNGVPDMCGSESKFVSGLNSNNNTAPDNEARRMMGLAHRQEVY